MREQKRTHFYCWVFRPISYCASSPITTLDLCDKKQMANRYQKRTSPCTTKQKNEEREKKIAIHLDSLSSDATLYYNKHDIKTCFYIINIFCSTKRCQYQLVRSHSIHWWNHLIWFRIYPSLFVYLFQKIVSSWPDCNIHAKPKTRERKKHTHAHIQSITSAFPIVLIEYSVHVVADSPHIQFQCTVNTEHTHIHCSRCTGVIDFNTISYSKPNVWFR